MSADRDDVLQNLTYAWAVLGLGMKQHDVASIFRVNSGRVAEAVFAARLAFTDPVRFAAEEAPLKNELRADPQLLLQNGGDLQ